MCMGKKPKVPAPLPERQAAQAPQIQAVGNTDRERQNRRLGYARLVTNRITPGVAPATTGKALLGQ